MIANPKNRVNCRSGSTKDRGSYTPRSEVFSPAPKTLPAATAATIITSFFIDLSFSKVKLHLSNPYTSWLRNVFAGTTTGEV